MLMPLKFAGINLHLRHSNLFSIAAFVASRASGMDKRVSSVQKRVAIVRVGLNKSDEFMTGCWGLEMFLISQGTRHLIAVRSSFDFSVSLQKCTSDVIYDQGLRFKEFRRKLIKHEYFALKTLNEYRRRVTGEYSTHVFLRYSHPGWEDWIEHSYCT